jgi:hypothetical protein
LCFTDILNVAALSSSATDTTAATTTTAAGNATTTTVAITAVAATSQESLTLQTCSRSLESDNDVGICSYQFDTEAYLLFQAEFLAAVEMKLISCGNTLASC